MGGSTIFPSCSFITGGKVKKTIAAKLPDPATWQSSTLRLTAFLGPTARVSENTWWADLIGKPPESRTIRQQKGEQNDQGPFEQGTIALNVNPARVDWLFVPKVDPEKFEGNMPTVGSFPEVVDLFLKFMQRWLTPPMCPPIQRLAFGAILHQPVDRRASGYALLNSFLPAVDVDPQNSSDLLYQINRPRQSTCGVKDLLINRVSKWSVMSVQFVGIQVDQAPTTKILGPENFACNVELDISTDKEFQSELPREQLSIIFQELVELGKEIARDGDIP